MSAFCVYGVTLDVARRLAERRGADDTDMETRIQHALSTAKPRQISPAFSAPQFCREWIEVARRTTGLRRYKIMVRTEKTDKQGAVVISKKTRSPTLTWKPYKD